jgi:hypothetical protein
MQLMIIKLTNNAEEFKGKPLLINTEHIMTVFEVKNDDETSTNIYSITQQSWIVKESLEDIYKLIK